MLHRPWMIALVVSLVLSACSDESGNGNTNLGTGGSISGGDGDGDALGDGDGDAPGDGDGDAAGDGDGDVAGDGDGDAAGDGDGDGDAPGACRMIPQRSPQVSCPGTAPPALSATRVATGLSSPIFVTAAPDDQSRLFVVERGGAIRIVDPVSGVINSTPFLDINVARGGDEQGLLGMAFHPDYANNGRFYVNYMRNAGGLRTFIAEFTVSTNDPDQADPNSERSLVDYGQPYSNHNGGMIAFGADDCLYIAAGDGGWGNDPENAGQTLSTPLGKVLRIDVDNPMAMAPGNMGAGYMHVWSYGLRNPWRFSFDRATGDMYIGDVGQDAWEEIDVEPAGAVGRNYGWKIQEGNHCAGDGNPAASCTSAERTPPVDELSQAVEGVDSVIGGYVYRGVAIPALAGYYLYADLNQQGGNPVVRSFMWDGAGGRCGSTTHSHDAQLTDIEGDVSSFGQDALGELYITSMDGHVYRIDPQ